MEEKKSRKDDRAILDIGRKRIYNAGMGRPFTENCIMGFAIASILILLLIPFNPLIFLALLFFLRTAEWIPAPSQPVSAAEQRPSFDPASRCPLGRAPPC